MSRRRRVRIRITAARSMACLAVARTPADALIISSHRGYSALSSVWS
jgi:hypothetical protein